MRAFSHAVVALLGAALPLSLYLYLVRPDRAAAVETAEKQLEARQKELQELGVVASRLPEFERERKALQERLALLEEIRPASRETGPLIERLRSLAAAEGLGNVSVEEIVPGTDRAGVPIRLSAEGAPRAIASLLERLTRTARLLRVERIELERREKGGYGVTLRVAALQDRPAP
jgi:Tfp pilus assembly protein PilO